MHRSMSVARCLFLTVVLSTHPGPISSQDDFTPVLQMLPSGQVAPTCDDLLDSPSDIERFLDKLEGTPPDWPSLYGNGEGHDERLFALNRERDHRREGHAMLEQRLACLWGGVSSE